MHHCREFVRVSCKVALRGLAVLVLPLLAVAPATANAEENPKVLLRTNMGDITIELYPGKAPETVRNFLDYVREGFYDGTIFHRVIDGFMIQGVGLTTSMEPKQGHAPIENEADNGLRNEAYTVAMARTMEPHSASSQFFINVNDNEFLNHREKSIQGWGYAVFGKVVAGQDTVDAIRKVETANEGMHDNVPVEPVLIEQAEVL